MLATAAEPACRLVPRARDAPYQAALYQATQPGTPGGLSARALWLHQTLGPGPWSRVVLPRVAGVRDVAGPHMRPSPTAASVAVMAPSTASLRPRSRLGSARGAAAGCMRCEREQHIAQRRAVQHWQQPRLTWRTSRLRMCGTPAAAWGACLRAAVLTSVPCTRPQHCLSQQCQACERADQPEHPLGINMGRLLYVGLWLCPWPGRPGRQQARSTKASKRYQHAGSSNKCRAASVET
jgi:hypothetical protein